MHYLRLLFLPLLLLSLAPGNYLVQYNYSTDVTYVMSLSSRDSSGSVSSPLPVPSPGACFDLYAAGGGCRDNYLYHLDTKVIGTYMPTASVSIASQDPSADLRTRADIPYTVTLSLQKDLDYPYADRPDDDSTTTAMFTRYGENYPEGTYRIEQSNSRNIYEIESYEMVEGDISVTLYNSILPNNYTKACGEETFAIYSEAIEKENCRREVIIRSVLDSKTIKVWPVAEASIQGVVDGERYIHALPDLSIDMVDLYPDSLTYAQLYAGSVYNAEEDETNSPPAITVLDATVRDYDTVVPQNQSIILKDWDNVIPEDGTYTIEIVTVTPFNNGQPERLTAITFEVDKEVSIRGSMTTSE